MDIDNLVHMANQIGEFFSAFPDQEEAKSGIATHIHKFWEPRMRTHLFQVLDAGGTGLRPLVIEAAANIRRPSAA